MNIVRGLLMVGLLMATSSTAYATDEYTNAAESASTPQDRGAIAMKDDWYEDSASRIVYLDQKWSPSDSIWFYYTSQGSELPPYDYSVQPRYASRLDHEDSTLA